MKCSRPPAWLLALPLAGLAVASSGCTGRPNAAAVAADTGPSAEGAPAPPGDAAGAPGDAKKDADGPPFLFPDDAGGALLARVLPPADVKGPLAEPNAGPRRTPLAAADVPSLPLPPTPPAPPPVPGERNHKSPAPHLVMEETLGLTRGDPLPPEPRSLYAGDRVRLPSPDVNQPPPLPILAPLPTPDRASLDDPTTDVSADAALAASMPERTKPAPYVRVTLPDPFDNRRPLVLPAPPEDDRPRTGTVHPPKP